MNEQDKEPEDAFTSEEPTKQESENQTKNLIKIDDKYSYDQPIQYGSNKNELEHPEILKATRFATEVKKRQELIILDNEDAIKKAEKVEFADVVDMSNLIPVEYKKSLLPSHNNQQPPLYYELKINLKEGKNLAIRDITGKF